MRIEVEEVSKAYGARRVVDRVSFEVRPGEVLALLGESGSGKSTLLGMVAGLIAPGAGRIRLGERTVNDPAVRVQPRERQIGMVFQDLALWPHMTVAEHLRFVAPRSDPRELLEALELSARANALPATLSGGEAQRLALGRALAVMPRFLLLDEPLGALDRRLKESLLGLVAAMHRRFGTTAIYVTHECEEALAIAGRVGVLAAGRLLQVGPPEEVYERPASETVARLTGPVSAFPMPDGSTVLARPEHVAVREDAAGRAKVRAVRYLGGRFEIEAEVDGRLVKAFAPRPLSGAVTVELAAGRGVPIALSSAAPGR